LIIIQKIKRPEKIRPFYFHSVGGTGFEPVTSGL